MVKAMRSRLLIASALLAITPGVLCAERAEPTIRPLVRVIDLDVGDSQEAVLCDGSKAVVKLLVLQETRDTVRDAIRRADVAVEVNGTQVSLVAATYHLPTTVGNVRIDCSVTKGYLERSIANGWALQKDARLRIWPADSPLIRPETFLYPIKQRWFASDTQFTNEPCFVNGAEDPARKEIYYHFGIDIGGAIGLVDVVAATDGTVVSCRGETLPDHADTSAVRARDDAIYVLDPRGWYYRYSHFIEVDPEVRLGMKIPMGKRLGRFGTAGGAGWSHNHFEILSPMPSGDFGSLDAYAFLWESYLREYKPKLLAIARPHHLVWVGEKVTLDGTRSYSAVGRIARYDWTFTDGKKAIGAKVERSYDRPGSYSEILKVTDSEGRIDYDFAVVQVIDRAAPESLPPSLQASYAPTFGIQPGDPVTFKVGTFRTYQGEEVIDFGDASPMASVKSECYPSFDRAIPTEGWAEVVHRYDKPGHYLICVQRTNRHGYKAVARLQVRVGERDVASAECR